METRDILKKLREERNLTQDELAEHVMVTRQAVSRWETGETQPNTDTLRLAVQRIQRVYQHTSRKSETACMSMLRNAAE